MLREGPLCLQRRTPIPGDAAVVTGRQSRQDHSSLHVSLCPVNQLRRDRKAPEGRTWGRGESQALNLSSCHSLGEGAQHGGGGSSPQGSHIYVWWGGLFSIVLQSSSVPPWSQQLTRLRTHWVPCSSVLTIRHGPTGGRICTLQRRKRRRRRGVTGGGVAEGCRWRPELLPGQPSRPTPHNPRRLDVCSPARWRSAREGHLWGWPGAAPWWSAAVPGHGPGPASEPGPAEGS